MIRPILSTRSPAYAAACTPKLRNIQLTKLRCKQSYVEQLRKKAVPSLVRHFAAPIDTIEASYAHRSGAYKIFFRRTKYVIFIPVTDEVNFLGLIAELVLEKVDEFGQIRAGQTGVGHALREGQHGRFVWRRQKSCFSLHWRPAIYRVGFGSKGSDRWRYLVAEFFNMDYCTVCMSEGREVKKTVSFLIVLPQFNRITLTSASARMAATMS